MLSRWNGRNVSSAKQEQRSHPRYDFPSTIEYILEPQEDGAVRKGVTINMSQAGLSAYVFESLPIGQKIIIKTGIPVAQQQSATIRWSRKRDLDFYLSGLKFT
jgi:hypothetical protein